MDPPVGGQRNKPGLVSSDWTRAQQDMTKPTKLLVRVLIHCRFWQPFRAFWCFVVASQDGVYFYGDRAYQPLGRKLLGLVSETYAETLWDREPSICVDFVVTTIAMINHDQSTWTSFQMFELFINDPPCDSIWIHVCTVGWGLGNGYWMA